VREREGWQVRGSNPAEPAGRQPTSRGVNRLTSRSRNWPRSKTQRRAALCPARDLRPAPTCPVPCTD
jgi:hypothetical protein